MPELHNTLRVVEVFLEARGYELSDSYIFDPSSNKKDGVWILASMRATVQQGVCLCCVDEYLKRLFDLMESGRYLFGEELCSGSSEWTRADTNIALQAGGFPPWK